MNRMEVLFCDLSSHLCRESTMLDQDLLVLTNGGNVEPRLAVCDKKPPVHQEALCELRVLMSCFLSLEQHGSSQYQSVLKLSVL